MKIITAFREIYDFLRARKKWWLFPIFIILIGLGLLMVFAAGSPFAPFIYTLF